MNQFEKMQLDKEELQRIYRHNLKSENTTRTIETLFSERYRARVNSSPYYQRNYVWDREKGSYFIESILLGTEIPPIVLFKSKDGIEIIDGKQRYETILKFMTNKLKLVKKGLPTLDYLHNMSYSELDLEVIDKFLDTGLRIIEFTLVGDDTSEEMEDLIKKEIFKRYNSGITPLRSIEVEKAKYINNDLNAYFDSQLKIDSELYEIYIDVFMSGVSRKNDKRLKQEVLKNIRKFITFTSVPITYYANSRNSVVDRFYEILSEKNEDHIEIYEDFKNKVLLIKEIKQFLGLEESLVYESIYWALGVLQHEKKDYFQINNVLEQLKSYIVEHYEVFDSFQSIFYGKIITRFNTIGSFLSEYFDIENIDLYIYSSGRKKDFSKPKEKKQLPEARTKRPSATSISIDSLMNTLKRNRFLLRPAYQREEVINKTKSTSIIESILLDIPLPSIFVYKRDDGIQEVIDGQQRLLSILAFLGQPFINEANQPTYSTKNAFKLHKPLILESYHGKKFEELSEDLKDKIFDYNLSIVEIDSELNPEFDPIDLFIRLNLKPYPIRENTFEMWNSYIDREIIQNIKSKTEQYKNWFHHEASAKRMQNEDLFTTLVYLDYVERQNKYNFENLTSKVVDFYQRNNVISIRIRKKYELTEMLEDASKIDENKRTLLHSIKNTDRLIRNVEMILIDKDINNLEEKDEYLAQELGSLFGIKKENLVKARKAHQLFILLWLLVKDLQKPIIKIHRKNMKEEITHIFKELKRDSELNFEENRVQGFLKSVNDLKEKYSVDKRSIILKDEEKIALIRSQNNICPICKSELYFGDDIHVDHIKPLSQGGKDEHSNLQIVHASCNLEKNSNEKYTYEDRRLF